MKLGLITATMVFAASSAFSQHMHQSGSPVEVGQSQFAAIAEIVALLRDDQDTDWAQVDIQALRDHLVDMDNVTTGASVEATVGSDDDGRSPDRARTARGRRLGVLRVDDNRCTPPAASHDDCNGPISALILASLTNGFGYWCSALQCL